MFLKNVKSKGLATFITVIILLVFFTVPALAQAPGLTDRSLSEIINSAIEWLLSIAAGLAILFIVIGGIYYLTAAGDEQRMSTGKTIITYSIVGLIFIIISYSIVLTVNDVITG